ncbi:MAG TPA: APC family permease [Candidatus Dormibacteraeota bacterium]
MIGRLREVLIGPPLPSSAAGHERLTRPRALGAFGLDALSSVAYGPDEILYVLLLAGAAGAQLDLPVAAAIALLLGIVTISYRQTIFAYPRGGGSYTVARENLGTLAGLTAAAALMVDYLTTVAVSVTAGVEAVTAFVPALFPYRVALGVGCIVLLMLVNIRGVREAGAFFVLPTYVFVGSLGLLVTWGLMRLALGGSPPHVASPPPAVEPLSLLLVLRAFAGGCTAMTGIEAIANGVPAFQKPESRNAAGTLVVLACILGALFLGVAVLGHSIGAVPSDRANVIAQIGQTVGGGGPLYYVVQVSAAVILLLAANTSFNGFPRLAAIMAEDDYFPHRFARRGLRLAFSNGIVFLGALAIVLVVVFGGSTHALIPLFAVGVFLCFTLSQAGMVVHWLRDRGRGWQQKLGVNGLGALTTGVVTLVVVGTKFREGAWIVVLLVPLLVVLFVRIHGVYAYERRALQDYPPPGQRRIHELALVVVARLNRSTAETLDYALSLGVPVEGVHVAVDDAEAERLREEWRGWRTDVPLRLVPSPYREIVAPLVDFVEERCNESPDRYCTVLVPEVVPRRWWHEPLHNQLGIAIELAFRGMAHVVVSRVAVRL